MTLQPEGSSKGTSNVTVPRRDSGSEGEEEGAKVERVMARKVGSGERGSGGRSSVERVMGGTSRAVSRESDERQNGR